jgi:hypothetical protein
MFENKKKAQYAKAVEHKKSTAVGSVYFAAKI